MAIPSSICAATALSRLRCHNLPAIRLFATCARLQGDQSNLPRVASPAFWRGLIPKALRRQQSEPGAVVSESQKRPGVFEKSPGLSLIVLGLLAGSFAINVMSLRREMTNFTRKTESKLHTLREVIGQVKNGEKVDVKRLLGTGDPTAEQEWEDVIRELETTDMLAASWERKAAKRLAQQEQRDASQGLQSQSQEQKAEEESAANNSKSQSRPKFMM